jgi:GGDEF domain-containing protein
MVEQLDEKECVVGMSMGLSHSALSLPVSAIELVRHADEAMYVAKSNGKLGGTKRVMVRYRHLESEMCVLPYTGSATVTNTNEPLSVKNNELRQAG